MVVTPRRLAKALLLVLLSFCAGPVLAQPLSNGLQQPPTRTSVPFAKGDLVTPPGSPNPSMSLDAGSPSSIMRFVLNGRESGRFGLRALAGPDSQGSGAFVGSDTVGAETTAPDESGTNTDLGTLAGSFTGAEALQATRLGSHARAGIAKTCNDDTERALQTGGEFWTPQARSVVPVQMPSGVFSGSRPGSRDPLALGPTGHPVNVPAAGPAGSWCRPPGVPMSQSGPLDTRAFWILAAFIAGVFAVFWLTRGFRLRGIYEP